MFTVKGEHYYNDFTRENFTRTFTTLDDIFKWLQTTSENFTNKYGNYFPDLQGRVGRISCTDENRRGYQCWIYQIENENGIVFSTGRYTSGKEFCATKIKEWCLECRKAIKDIQNMPNFVEC